MANTQTPEFWSHATALVNGRQIDTDTAGVTIPFKNNYVSVTVSVRAPRRKGVQRRSVLIELAPTGTGKANFEGAWIELKNGARSYQGPFSRFGRVSFNVRPGKYTLGVSPPPET